MSRYIQRIQAKTNVQFLSSTYHDKGAKQDITKRGRFREAAAVRSTRTSCAMAFGKSLWWRPLALDGGAVLSKWKCVRTFRSGKGFSSSSSVNSSGPPPRPQDPLLAATAGRRSTLERRRTGKRTGKNPAIRSCCVCETPSRHFIQLGPRICTRLPAWTSAPFTEPRHPNTIGPAVSYSTSFLHVSILRPRPSQTTKMPRS